VQMPFDVNEVTLTGISHEVRKWIDQDQAVASARHVVCPVTSPRRQPAVKWAQAFDRGGLSWMAAKLTAGRTCPACGSGDYQFRSRKKGAEKQKGDSVETK
jgi:hypothetical protein